MAATGQTDREGDEPSADLPYNSPRPKLLMRLTRGAGPLAPCHNDEHPMLSANAGTRTRHHGGQLAGLVVRKAVELAHFAASSASGWEPMRMAPRRRPGQPRRRATVEVRPHSVAFSRDSGRRQRA